MVGRYVQIPRGDGHALYMITKVLKRTCHLDWVYGVGDDWSVPEWGAGATVDKNFVETNVRIRDDMAELFGRK